MSLRLCTLVLWHTPSCNRECNASSATEHWQGLWHSVLIEEGRHLVNDRGEALNKSISHVEQRSVDRIALHHYCTKSLEVCSPAEVTLKWRIPLPPQPPYLSAFCPECKAKIFL